MSMIAQQVCTKVLDFCGIAELDPKVTYYGGHLDHKLYIPLDEIIAGIYGAQGYLVAKIWDITHHSDHLQEVKINIPHSFLSIGSPLLLRANGYPVYPWEPKYPTMGLYQDKKGRYIYLHGGHPKLRDIILKTLNTSNEQENIAHAVSKREALELEESIAEAGGCAAVVRTAEEWEQHPQGELLKNFPPVFANYFGESVPKPLLKTSRPLEGLRVLDWTHVIAAPLCARTLAEHGAEVLHISAPQLPQIPAFVIDTSHGKRQAYLDMNNTADKEKMWELLKNTDVFITGWTPGQTEKWGFSPREVAAKVPGIIIVTLSCYGIRGPWAHRPGWEQLGQTVSGMLDKHSRQHHKMTDIIHTHGVFPCDFTTGLLAGASILATLIKRHYVGGSYHIHISLVRSGMWLHQLSLLQSTLTQTVPFPVTPELLQTFMQTQTGPLGKIDYIKPVVELSETNPYYALPSAPLGSHEPLWLLT